MRILASIILLLTVLVLGFFGYCYFGAQMQIVGIYPTLTPATNAATTYEEIKQQIEINAFSGTSYVAEPSLTTPAEYAFLTYTVRMRNPGLLPQDYIRIEVQNLPGDLLQLAADRTPSLASHTTSDFSATILVPAGSTEAARSIRVTYYVLGRPMEARMGN